MTLKMLLIAASLGGAALAGTAAPAQARTVAIAYNDGYYQPVGNYRDRDRRDWDRRDRRDRDRYDRWDNRRDRHGWNGRNGWNNDRRYRQQCWKEWRYDRWSHRRYRVKICR